MIKIVLTAVTNLDGAAVRCCGETDEYPKYLLISFPGDNHFGSKYRAYSFIVMTRLSLIKTIYEKHYYCVCVDCWKYLPSILVMILQSIHLVPCKEMFRVLKSNTDDTNNLWNGHIYIGNSVTIDKNKNIETIDTYKGCTYFY